MNKSRNYFECEMATKTGSMGFIGGFNVVGEISPSNFRKKKEQSFDLHEPEWLAEWIHGSTEDVIEELKAENRYIYLILGEFVACKAQIGLIFALQLVTNKIYVSSFGQSWSIFDYFPNQLYFSWT